MHQQHIPCITDIILCIKLKLPANWIQMCIRDSYGIYKTADGYIALAMVPIPYLGELINCSELTKYTDPSLSDKRDEIKSILSKHLITETTSHWLSLLEPADIWCCLLYTSYWCSTFCTRFVAAFYNTHCVVCIFYAVHVIIIWIL